MSEPITYALLRVSPCDCGRGCGGSRLDWVAETAVVFQPEDAGLAAEDASSLILARFAGRLADDLRGRMPLPELAETRPGPDGCFPIPAALQLPREVAARVVPVQHAEPEAAAIAPAVPSPAGLRARLRDAWERLFWGFWTWVLGERDEAEEAY